MSLTSGPATSHLATTLPVFHGVVCAGGHTLIAPRALAGASAPRAGGRLSGWASARHVALEYTCFHCGRPLAEDKCIVPALSGERPRASAPGRTGRLDARTAAANPFGYRSSSPSALAASKSSTRARRTDVFGPAERLPDARRRATRARRARRPRAARAHRPSSPRCAVESSRLPRPPRAAFFFTRAGVSVPSSARAVLSRAVCCCRHDG